MDRFAKPIDRSVVPAKPIAPVWSPADLAHETSATFVEGHAQSKQTDRAPGGVEAATPRRRVRVFYDGSCPLCRVEIAFLARRDRREGLEFVDISTRSPGESVCGPLTCGQAMRRMHVEMPDGELRSGARAFLAMWGVIPGWRWLARLLSIPPSPIVLEGLYRVFLVVRPHLQVLAGARREKPRQ
ncbi:MAG: thiol-disulfide oxidoreductase DCC family protein [Hyphomicrobiaceae bacterium]